jgi:hypothetical protein
VNHLLTMLAHHVALWGPLTGLLEGLLLAFHPVPGEEQRAASVLQLVRAIE